MIMRKFDASSGLSRKEIGIIKYNLKREISRQLPELPDPVETKLFLRGRDAWLFGWSLLNKNFPIKSHDVIYLEVAVKLKKEFYHNNITTHYIFSCKIHMQEDIYHPKLSVSKRTA